MANSMDILVTSLEALIQRATNVGNQGPDTAAIEAFCGLVCQKPESVQVAAKFITAKIHSLHEWEALQALLVLENCMKRCGPHFHAEVGKFRFLNELIKLVSPKYLGAHTPEPVRRRVVELMFSWTLLYPRETKIKEAYEMLKKQGVVKEEPPVPPKEPSRPPASILQDEEKSLLLQRLLQSKNPQDLQAANRLIKTMVKEEERRVEEKWRLTAELETIVNNCRLLSEMVDSYQEGATSDQELELMKELYATCDTHRPVLFKLVNESSDAVFCHEVLTTNDELIEVISRYKSVVERQSKLNHSEALRPSPKPSTLLDLSPSPVEGPVSSAIEQLSCLDLGAPSQTPSMNVLKDVFSSIETPSASNIPGVNYIPRDLLGTSLVELPTSDLSEKKESKSRGLEELDLLGETLLKETLSSSKPSVEIRKEEVEEPTSSLASSLLEDDLLLSLTPNHIELTPSASPLPSNSPQPKEVLPLGDISLTLDNVKPSCVPPYQALDDRNGISTVIHLAKNCPRPDVSVYVVTTTNRNEFSLNSFLFRPIVPKTCRLKLLTASSTQLPAYNPFLPPSAITQLMLIASPTKEPITLKFVVSYTQEDEETITIMGEIANLLMTAE